MATNTYKKLAAVSVTDAAPQVVVAAVPASTEYLIKHMRVVNNDVVDHTIAIWQDGTTNPENIMPPTTIDAGGWAEFDGLVIMETGDILYAQSDVVDPADDMTLTVYALVVG